MPTELGLTTRNGTSFFHTPNTPTQYTAHAAHCLMGAGNKGLGFETDKKHPTSTMKDERYIPPFLYVVYRERFTFIDW
jgi:hypothetical protein